MRGRARWSGFVLISMHNQSIIILDAPSNLGLRPPLPGRVPGVYRMPDALRAADLVAKLNALDGGRLIPPAYHHELDSAVGVRNANGIYHFSLELAERVQSLIQQGYFPLVLGGDCSILLGSMLALRRIGRYGLLFIDGHTDFGTPETSGTGGAAGMDLALATGYGLELLANMEGLRPLVQERDVVLFGNRDVEDRESYPWRAVFQTGITHIDLNTIRGMGIRQAIEQAVAHFRRAGVAGVWVHVDADVLDDVVMPAVDSRQPDGMSYAELIVALQTMLASGLAVGMEVTIYDPDLDPDGSIAAAFISAMTQSFSRSHH